MTGIAQRSDRGEAQIRAFFSDLDTVSLFIWEGDFEV